jgi:hypothetical protein
VAGGKRGRDGSGAVGKPRALNRRGGRRPVRKADPIVVVRSRAPDARRTPCTKLWSLGRYSNQDVSDDPLDDQGPGHAT